MSEDYYGRKPNADGSFEKPDDRRAQIEVGEILSKAWRCVMHRYPQFSPIDWYGERNGKIVCFAELKTRTHGKGEYPTVFLNVRKWLALQIQQIASGVPSFYIVRFTDSIRWIQINDVDASQMRMGGCVRRVKSDCDHEPVIEVPVDVMKPLKKREESAA